MRAYILISTVALLNWGSVVVAHPRVPGILGSALLTSTSTVSSSTVSSSTTSSSTSATSSASESPTSVSQTSFVKKVGQRGATNAPDYSSSDSPNQHSEDAPDDSSTDKRSAAKVAGRGDLGGVIKGIGKGKQSPGNSDNGGDAPRNDKSSARNVVRQAAPVDAPAVPVTPAAVS